MKAAPTLDTRGGGSQLPSSGNWGWLANLPETETETETETHLPLQQVLVHSGSSFVAQQKYAVVEDD
jgi:hypothetical protein